MQVAAEQQETSVKESDGQTSSVLFQIEESQVGSLQPCESWSPLVTLNLGQLVHCQGVWNKLLVGLYPGY